MTVGWYAETEGLLREAYAAFRDCLTAASDVDMVDGLRIGGLVESFGQRMCVDAVAALSQRGVFSQHGQRPVNVVAEVLGMDHPDAARIVTAADQARPRADLQGQVLPARLEATAAAFDAGDASLRHVEVISRLLASEAARRLDPDTWATAETQLAAHTADLTPHQLQKWGAELIEVLDQDGAEPDDREPAQTNELFLSRNPNGQGGRIKGRIDDAAMYDVIAAILDAKSAPLTADDTRPQGERLAHALAEVCGWVADHGDTTIAPSAGGRRPTVNVLIRLADLQNRARAAVLDFGGVATPTELRRLCCDACIIPIVMNGAGQPLDVGRSRRTIPDGLRRAVAARDRGCAHPGCTRPISWTEIHHIFPWELGGETTLSNLVMLCATHHRQMHSSGWEVRIASDGLPEFIPPAWIDVEQRPRRNPPMYPTPESLVDPPPDPVGAR